MESEIRKPTDADVEYIVNNIRQADADEIEALDGKTIKEVFDEMPNLKEISDVWVVDGKPCCIYGVTPHPEDSKVGVIWMIAAEGFHKHSKFFGLRCKPYVEKLLDGYDYVFNYIHTKNRVSIQWLEWLGFTIHEPDLVGYKGETFSRFEYKNV